MSSINPRKGWAERNAARKRSYDASQSRQDGRRRTIAGRGRGSLSASKRRSNRKSLYLFAIVTAITLDSCICRQTGGLIFITIRYSAYNSFPLNKLQRLLFSRPRSRLGGRGGFR